MKQKTFLIESQWSREWCRELTYNTSNPRWGRHFTLSVNCGVKNDFTAVANIHAPKLQLSAVWEPRLILRLK